MEDLKLTWEAAGKPTSVVVYKKSANAKKYYAIVTDFHVDVINNANARKPMIDHKYTIVELGIGINFWYEWSKKYNIKKPEIIAK